MPREETRSRILFLPLCSHQAMQHLPTLPWQTPAILTGRGVSLPGHGSRVQTLPLCLLLTWSTPPVKLSPRSSTSATHWHLPKAAQSLMAEPVLSGGICLPCLRLAGGQEPPSCHPTAGGTQLCTTHTHELQEDKRTNSNEERS